MGVESTLAEFAVGLRDDEVTPSAKTILRHMVLAVTGAGIAGAQEDGIAELRALLLEAGGTGVATTLFYGDRLPANAAAQFNATMCRALDYCDAMAPGPHIGSSLFAAALAAAEQAGSCSGASFTTALAVGAEISSRLNLSEAQYDGFDPTGIPVVFGSTAAAARILGLSPEQTLHAMALAFNRCGGSFQSHVDGSLGVRFVQGWVAQAAVQCAQLAQRGITGPENFITGHYGYGHLYGRDELDFNRIVAGLGRDWRLQQMMFKKYPSCGVTQGVTELALNLIAEGVRASDIAAIQVHLPPYAHRLVGKTFEVGVNPRVDAQFSAAYCVANAFVRGASKIAHFSPEQVADAATHELIDRTQVVAEPTLDARGHTAVDLRVSLRDGRELVRSLDTAPGYPGANLTDVEHRGRFEGCLDYAPVVLSASGREALWKSISTIEALADVRAIIPRLTFTEDAITRSSHSA